MYIYTFVYLRLIYGLFVFLHQKVQSKPHSKALCNANTYEMGFKIKSERFYHLNPHPSNGKANT